MQANTWFEQLNRLQQRIVQALAIFKRPIAPEGVSSLLEPYLDDQERNRVASVLDELAHSYRAFVSEGGGCYWLAEPAPVLDTVEIGDSTDPYEAGQPLYTRYALCARAAAYYRQRRTPPETWTSLDDLAAQFGEFEMRCLCEDYHGAAELLADISFNYLLKWGHYRLVIELRERLAPHLEEPTLAQANWGELGTAYAYLGEMHKAIACQEQALEIARRRGDWANEGVWLANLGNRYNNLGQTRRALEYYAQALQIARALGDLHSEGVNLGSIAVCHVYQGQIETALEHFTEALMIARALKDINQEGYLLANLGNVYASLGQLTRAIAVHDQAIAIAQQTGRRVEEARRLGNLAEALIMHGQFDEAIDSLKQGLQIDDEIGYVRGKSFKYCSLACVYLLQGELMKAREAAEMACRWDAPQNNHNARAMLGLVALRQEDRETAARAFGACLEMGATLLEHNPRNYDVWNTHGLAYSGLAILEEDGAHAAAAAQSYAEAQSISRPAGLVGHSLRLFDELAVMDRTGLLQRVRAIIAESDG